MKIYCSIISVISFALSIYILILNLFCTCFTTADRFQMNYFSGDIVIFNLLAIALAILGVIFCDRIKIREFADKHFTALKIFLLVLTAVIGVIFSLSWSEKPALKWFVAGFFRSISSWATFMSPQMTTPLRPARPQTYSLKASSHSIR